MKLYALSDLHVGFEANRRALETLDDHRASGDWLVLGGDLGESLADVELVLAATTRRFARVLWVPGNHELWTSREDGLAGVAKYEALVALCRRRDVLTPEDPYPIWPGEGPPCVIAPLFLLYDYSFRPDDVPREGALEWAAEAGHVCSDEDLLRPDPFPSREAWCAARCETSEARLAAIDPAFATVLVNHFPLRYEHARLPLLPRFTLWCGTKRTTDWHTRFRARVVVTGHLHIPTTRHCDGVRFEEVSVGYPRQWRHEAGLEVRLREILPGPAER